MTIEKDNTYRNSWLLVLFLTIAFVIGCASKVMNTPQPILHPIAGTSVMFIPKGTKIGDQVAPENGLYISESTMIQSMKRQQEQRNKKRT
jgi:hypothetical protein